MYLIYLINQTCFYQMHSIIDILELHWQWFVIFLIVLNMWKEFANFMYDFILFVYTVLISYPQLIRHFVYNDLSYISSFFASLL